MVHQKSFRPKKSIPFQPSCVTLSCVTLSCATLSCFTLSCVALSGDVTFGDAVTRDAAFGRLEEDEDCDVASRQASLLAQRCRHGVTRLR
jgi:hypothetical protein